MASYEYTALDAAGKRIAGVLTGASEQTVLAELERRQLVPVHIEEKRQRRGLGRARLSPRKLAEVYVQLGDMLQAGVPVLKALRVLAGQKNPKIAGVFGQIASAVEDGEALATAMEARPDVFKPTHIAILRAGEQGGFLEEAMIRLGQFVESQAELQSKLIGSLIYPVVLVVIGSGVLTIIFTVLIPMVQPMFDRIEKLPAVTNLVFAVAAMTSTYLPLVLVILGCVVGGYLFVRKKPAFVQLRDRALLAIPLLGPLIRAIAVARFSRMLGTMLGNGVPLLRALSTAKAAAGNVVLEDAIDKAAEDVGAGASLAASLGQSGLFSTDVIEMLVVGEESGNIDKVLMRIAVTVESRIERLLSNLIKLVEPLLIAMIAVVVLVVAIGLILPLTQLSDIG